MVRGRRLAIWVPLLTLAALASAASIYLAGKLDRGPRPTATLVVRREAERLDRTSSPESSPRAPRPTATDTQSPTRPPSSGSPGPTLAPTPDLIARLRQNPMPPRDYAALIASLQGEAALIRGLTRHTPAMVEIGDKKIFWIADVDLSRTYQITATLRTQGEHLQMWVEEGASVEQSALERSANVFDARIYPTNHEYFGREWTPGIDGDPRLVVLNARFTGAAGYFASSNEYTREVNPYSNQHEMFFMNLDALQPGTAQYEAVLAHEFQHMIHWNLDSNEEAWLNEGASELAEEVNGFGWPSEDVARFESDPDLQLNTWTDAPADTGAHYGASYLMMRYLLDRFGSELLRAVVQNQSNGIASLDLVLAQRGTHMTFDDLFADWVVANALDVPHLSDGRYGYAGIDVGVKSQLKVFGYPHAHEGHVHQYAADYIELFPSTQAPCRIIFTGTQEVKLVPTDATSGDFQWWSNRGDASHSYLQRTFDLTRVTTATLSFDLWFDIETGWDYAYVRASSDGGKTWHFLRGRFTSDYNPNGHALGPGYTGRSGAPIAAGQPARMDDTDAVWVRETMALKPFCGQQAMIRFDYVTDDAVNKPGLCLDDLALDPLGFLDDVESGADEWQAEGFLRHDNRLPQRYIVQLVEFGQVPKVRRLPVGSDGRGEWLIEGFGGEVERALLIISAIAPVTTQTASYRLRLEQLPQASHERTLLPGEDGA